MRDSRHDILFDPVPIDLHYMNPVLALAMRRSGHAVTLVIPAGRACPWGSYTSEQFALNTALVCAGVTVLTDRVLHRIADGAAHLACLYGGEAIRLGCDAVLPVTRRIPDRALLDALATTDHGLRSLTLIGDADAPSLI